MHLQQRILVTGGAGFLGSHLCERLLAEGGDVLCADNFFTGTRKNIEQKAEIDDTRASLSYKLKRTLQMCARKVLTTGPFVTTDPHICRSSKSLSAATSSICAHRTPSMPRRISRASPSSTSGAFSRTRTSSTEHGVPSGYLRSGLS